MPCIRLAASMFVLATVASAAAQESASPRREVLSKPFSFRLGPGIPLAEPAALSLLQDPVIQRELKLVDLQRKALNELEGNAVVWRVQAARGPTAQLDAYDRQRKELNSRSDKNVSSNTPERDFLAAQLSQAEEQVRVMVEKRSLAVLSPAQRKRFEQIRLQVEGPMSFMRPEVQARFSIDPATAMQIQGILASANFDERERIGAVERTLPGFPSGVDLSEAQIQTLDAAVDQAREVVLKARQGTMLRIARFLSKRQREAYNKALGEPFDSTPLREPKKTDEPAK